MRDRGGDALAGRLIGTLERERVEILLKVGDVVEQGGIVR